MNIERDRILFLPGPVELHPAVYTALGRKIIGHRTPSFSGSLERVYELLAEISGVPEDDIIVLLPSSGTGAMEAAIYNILSPGDRVLCFDNGVFGERFYNIARARGCDAIRVSKEWGLPFSAEDTRVFLEKYSDVQAITIVHSETSTGVLNPIKEIAEVARSHGVLVIVDAVSSFMVEENVATLGDIVITASQKGIAGPPGIGIVFENETARKREREGSFYFSFAKYRKYFRERKQTPFTPPVNIAYGFLKALEIIKSITGNKWIEWHKKIWRAINETCKILGLKQYPLTGAESRAVNVFLHDDANRIVSLLADRNIRIAGGQSFLSGKILRIGAMGWLRWAHLVLLAHSLARALNQDPGKAISTMEKYISPRDFPSAESG